MEKQTKQAKINYKKTKREKPELHNQRRNELIKQLNSMPAPEFDYKIKIDNKL